MKHLEVCQETIQLLQSLVASIQLCLHECKPNIPTVESCLKAIENAKKCTKNINSSVSECKKHIDKCSNKECIHTCEQVVNQSEELLFELKKFGQQCTETTDECKKSCLSIVPICKKSIYIYRECLNKGCTVTVI